MLSLRYMRKSKFFELALLLLIAMIWGFAFVAQLGGVQHVGSFTMNGVRFAVGVISLIPVVLFFEKGRTAREERKRTVVASAVAGSVLFFGVDLSADRYRKDGERGSCGIYYGTLYCACARSLFLFI